jgi:hypothetical protein
MSGIFQMEGSMVGASHRPPNRRHDRPRNVLSATQCHHHIDPTCHRSDLPTIFHWTRKSRYQYQSLVGGLLWFRRHTRPDISTASSSLSLTAIRQRTFMKGNASSLTSRPSRYSPVVLLLSVNVSIDPNSASDYRRSVLRCKIRGPQDACHPSRRLKNHFYQ